jgi:hypothetical protein
MKKLIALSAIIAVSTVCYSYSAVLITNFSEPITADAPWVWSSANATLSITSPNSSAGSLYPDSPVTAYSIGSNNQFQLTLANTVSGGVTPGGGFRVSLESNGGGAATAIFSWSTFTTSTTGTATFSTSGGFNPSEVVQWNIFDGGSGGTGALTGARLTSLQAVPEPSTYALLAIAAVGFFLSIRRRKVQD